MYALISAFALLAPTAETPPPPDVIVVAAADMVPALRPWFAHRQAQGHTLGLLPNTLSKEEIRASIRESAASGRLTHVVLVGDAAADRNDNAAARARIVPTHLEKARVNVLFGGPEPEIAGDNYYADLDDDDAPDLAIGRLPVDTPEELSQLVEKIIAFENSHDDGAWRQRINLIAGVGGFSPLIDSVLEMSTRKFLCEGIPTAYTTNMTYGSWRSPYCPDPRKFHAATVERLNEGSLFWVYIGHGQKSALDRVQVPGNHYHILGQEDVAECRCTTGQPIAIFLACYTGAYDQPDDCLAEAFVRHPRGPVAALAGSRVTMPYAMAVLGTGMMDEYFQKKRATLGEVVMHAKRRMMEDDKESANRALLDAIAAVISPKKELLAAERREHLYLFNLLGDPLLRLKHSEEVQVASPTAADAGQEIEVAVQAPFAGKCRVELICRRDQLKFEAPQRELYLNAEDVLAEFQATYAAANDRTWTTQESHVPAGEFRTRVEVPAECRGFCHVRVTMSSGERYALGASNLFVHAVKQVAAE
jgi:hypothetical protein